MWVYHHERLACVPPGQSSGLAVYQKVRLCCTPEDQSSLCIRSVSGSVVYHQDGLGCALEDQFLLCTMMVLPSGQWSDLVPDLCTTQTGLVADISCSALSPSQGRHRPVCRRHWGVRCRGGVLVLEIYNIHLHGVQSLCSLSLANNGCPQQLLKNNILL